jgi:predicted FMN-binding regulatory protein PaiB
VYVPRHFRPEREEELYAVIERYFFAEIVSAVDGEPPRATPAPFVLREEDGRRRLWGHMARANPHWREFRPEREVLAVFRRAGGGPPRTALNQNHSVANRRGAIAGLEALGGDDARQIARLIREREA